MANVGKGPAGYPLTGRGASSPSGATFLPIGSESGLTAHGVVVAEGTGAFVATAVGTAGQVLTSNGPGLDPTFQTNSANDYHVARFIVSAGGATDGANYTTIASAITAAVSAGGNQTIFIQPGTYTENLTLAAGVNLTAFPCDAYNPSVTIVGKATATFAGTCSISGICLQTNGDFCLTVTGSANTVVNLIGCNINCTNSVAINLETSGASAALNMYNCIGNTSSASNGIFSSTNTYVGGVFMKGCKFTNTSGANVGNIFAGTTNLSIYDSSFQSPFSTSLSTSATIVNTLVDTSSAVNGNSGFNGSGNTNLYNCVFITATAACFSTSATVTATHCTLNSSAANVVTGAGTLKYGFIVFTGSSSSLSVSTQTPLATLI